MVIDYFLKIDGVPGESKDDKYKGEIALLSFFWGASISDLRDTTCSRT
jgi:type VI secretion system secreted protein Hcp